MYRNVIMLDLIKNSFW